jgi:hypothetical protein
MKRAKFLKVSMGLVMLVAAPAAWSATASDWPCVQRKVPEIALAAVWTGPQLDAASANWRADPAVADLVQFLAARRTSESEARQAITAFGEASGEAKVARLLAVMAGLFETVNAERSAVIAGLERFGNGQKQLATLIRSENTTLSKMRADAKADPARIAEQSERLVWNLRIFDERQKSLSFVCEVPVLIEQRLFALAKEIAKALKEP